MSLHQKNEFENVVKIVKNFFESSEKPSEFLNLFQKKDWSGWEKWWQMELAAHIDSLDYIADVAIEIPYQKDQRYTTVRQDKMFLDIGFRLKNHKKDQWQYIELKRRQDYRHLIEEMLLDIAKVSSARHSSGDFGIRHIACVGIYSNKEGSDESTVMECATNSGIHRKRICIFPISKYHHLIIISKTT